MVPSGGPRRGRRDNGLVAEEYTLVADVEEHVGEYLLDLLAASGVAAYLQPATGADQQSRAPSQDPTVRLYADSTQLDTARDYLAQLDANNPPESSESPQSSAGQAQDEANATVTGADTDADDVDAMFARIVARFNETSAIDVVPWPAAEDLATGEASGTENFTAAETDKSDKSGGPFRRRRSDNLPDRANGVDDPDGPSLIEALDLFGADLPDASDEEGYTPPPAPPLPRLSTATVAGLLAIVAGIVLFFWPSVLPTDPNMALLLGFTAILAGFVTLILRMRPRGEDDDTDDGARV